MPRLAVQAKIGTALQLGAPRTISAARAGHREQSRDAVSIAGFGAVHLNRIMPGATDALLAGALQGWLLNARNPPSRLGPVPEVARNPTDQPDRPSGLNSDSPFGSASAGEDEAVHRIPAQRRRASSGTEPSPVRQRLVPRMSRRRPHTFIERQFTHARRQKNGHVVGRFRQKCPLIFIAHQRPHRYARAINAKVSLELGSRISRPMVQAGDTPRVGASPYNEV